MLSSQTPVCEQVAETFYYCQMFVCNVALQSLALTINTSQLNMTTACTEMLEVQ